MRANPLLRPLTADEFLSIDFPDWFKAELVDGEIVAMAGGTQRHARVQANVMIALGMRLRGSGCAPLGSDFAVRTPAGNIRYPDVSVVCGANDDRDKSTAEPRVLVEILSPSTARRDAMEKVPEYKEFASLQAVLLIDPEAERVRLIERTGAEDWAERTVEGDVALRCLNLGIPRAEIFARD